MVGNVDDVHTRRGGIGAKDGAPLRRHGVGNGKGIPVGNTDAEEHSFGKRRGPVIHRGVDDGKTDKLRHEALVLVEGLKHPLGHFRLVGRIGGGEFAT